MAKTYIVAPNFSIGVKSLHLGDVIVNPLGPELVPLNRNCRRPIDPNDLNEVGIMTSFSSTRKTLLSGRFGLWTTFLATLGLSVGVDLGLFLERNSNDVIKAGELETHEFIVTGKYVDEVLAQDDVKTYLDGRRYRVPVYMVSGLKIAKGASVNLDETTKVDAKIGLTAPESVNDVKPLFQFIRNRTEGIAFNSKTDFILAFRVRRVIFVGGEARHQLSTEGTSMMDGGDEARELPQAKLEGDLSLDNAKEEAEKEEVAVMAAKDDDGDDFEWIVTDGKFE